VNRGLSTVSTGRLGRVDLLLYCLGDVLALLLFASVEGDFKRRLILVSYYIPLFLFYRYLHRHGGMGWKWPG
jgi:hypothetical protein